MSAPTAIAPTATVSSRACRLGEWMELILTLSSSGVDRTMGGTPPFPPEDPHLRGVDVVSPAGRLRLYPLAYRNATMSLPTVSAAGGAGCTKDHLRFERPKATQFSFSGQLSVECLDVVRSSRIHSGRAVVGLTRTPTLVRSRVRHASE